MEAVFQERESHGTQKIVRPASLLTLVIAFINISSVTRVTEKAL